MENLFKVHFINFFFHGYKNTGDLFCSPLLYFADYFRKYNVIMHQIQSPKYFEISKNDVVILGGGGILFDNWNDNINKILECCDNVIIWGAGTNSNDIDAYYNHDIKINFSKCKLVGVRDFRNNAGLQYTPCPSCMLPLIKEARNINPKERIGTMLSFGYKPDKHYKNLDHFHNINEVFDFISNYEVIITSSYHCAYWSTLCGRKVIALSDGTTSKLINQKYAPPIIRSKTFYDAKALKKIIDSQAVYVNALTDCINATYSFFDKVKNIVDNLSTNKLDNYSWFNEKMLLASIESRFNSYTTRIDALEKKIKVLEKK